MCLDAKFIDMLGLDLEGSCTTPKDCSQCVQWYLFYSIYVHYVHFCNSALYRVTKKKKKKRKEIKEKRKALERLRFSVKDMVLSSVVP